MPPGVYSSALWCILWTIILLLLIVAVIRTKLWHNIPSFLLHLSFILMIAGGFFTASTALRGTLHLSNAVPADSFIDSDGTPHPLPAELTLLSFAPEYYRGMTVPKDFRSEVLTSAGDTMHISMNHIGHLGTYRFYQTSFDNDGGSILTVTHDPWGMPAVYLGFLLFAVGGGWILVRKFRRFRRAAIIGVLFLPASLLQEASAVPAVSNQTADSLAFRQVLYNGGIVPFSTVASRLTYKLTGRSDVGGLSPEAFVASLLRYREEWSAVPFIKVKSHALRDRLNIEGDYASVRQLYDGTTYLPGELYEGGKGSLDADIVSLDEKIALLVDLWSGRLFTPLPEASPDLRPEWSIRLEVAYNHIVPVRLLFVCSIIVTLLSLCTAITRWKVWLWPLTAVIGMLGTVAYLWLWFISRSFPLSTTSEMMEFLGVTAAIIATFICRRKDSALLTGLVMAGTSFLFLVSWLGVKDPVMSPVMPVLASPWLAVHVSLIMVAYAILGFTLPTSVIALIRPRQRKRLTALSMSLLGPGVYILGLGIIVGAMWANVSWGRYWAWDPKETWALVTLLLYSIPLHRWFGLRNYPRICNIYLIVIFSAIIMTYYGVNFLPSLHAYK